MKQQIIKYCEICARRIISEWRGWPHKQVLPDIPKIENGLCTDCGNSSSLASERITWFNFHSEFNTGLPDYWLLEIDGARTKWGHPYYGECKCIKCSEKAVLSEMKFPNGKHEFKCNCSQCGVQKADNN